MSSDNNKTSVIKLLRVGRPNFSLIWLMCFYAPAP